MPLESADEMRMIPGGAGEACFGSLSETGHKSTPKLPDWLKIKEPTPPSTSKRPQGTKTESHRTWPIWSTYAKEAAEFDRRVMREWNESMDVLLIFAGLFCAVVTTLLQTSYEWLRADHRELSYRLLYASYTGKRSEVLDDPELPFSPPDWSVRVNVLWMSALILSLGVAAFAMLAKTWISEYGHVLPAGPYEKALRHQSRIDGVNEWHMFRVIEVLPLLLHVSVVLFCCGLIDMSCHSNSPFLFITTFLCCGVVLLAYVLFCFSPLLDPNCPYKTPWFALLKLSTPSKPAIAGHGRSDRRAFQQLQEARALAWLFEEALDTEVAFETVSAALDLEGIPAQLKVLTRPGVLPILCRMFLATDIETRALQLLQAIYALYEALPVTPEFADFNTVDDLFEEFYPKLGGILEKTTNDELLAIAIQLADVLRKRNALFLSSAHHFSITRLVEQISHARFVDHRSLCAALDITTYMIHLPGYIENHDWTLIEESNLRKLVAIATKLLDSSYPPVVQESALQILRGSTVVVKLAPVGWLSLNQDLYTDPKSGPLPTLLKLLQASGLTDCRLRRRVREVLCELMDLKELDGVCEQWIVKEGHIRTIIYDFRSFHVTTDTSDDCSPLHVLVQVMDGNRLAHHINAFLDAGTLSALRAYFDRNRYDRPSVTASDVVSLLRALLSLVGSPEEQILRDSMVLQTVISHFRGVELTKAPQMTDMSDMLRQAKVFCEKETC